ncbi:hypothetical protein [Lutimonas sp.]|uniref:hypothetical protein n=1 Tax=Lutimonas sp. TaxID=1872403 RepID=UPI003D9BA4E1
MLHVTITLLGILFFITSGSFAKNTSVLFDGDSIAGIIKSDSLLNWNKEYLIAVHNKSTQKESKFLSGIISEWDITKAPDFGTKEDDYTAVFITTKGQAEVIYNYEGRIINVKKHLKNIMLPVHVYKTVAKKFKGWDIVQNKYKLSFKSGAEVLKTYVVTLEKGSRKKIFHLKI